jgi:hypothetical protein
LQISTNAGSTFTEVDGGGRLSGLNIRGVVKRGNTIVISVDKADLPIAANVGVFRSTDGGTNFTQISSGDGSVTGIPAGRGADLVSDPASPTTLYVGVFSAASFGPGANGLFKSTDFGATWSRVSDAAVDAALTATVNNIKLAAGPSASVYAAIADNGSCSAVFRSGDGGATWTAMDLPTTQENGVPANGTVGIHPGGQGQKHFSLCADPTNPNIVYIGGDRQPQGFQDTGAFPNAVGANTYSARMFRGDASQPANSQWVHLTHSSATGPVGGGTANNSAPHADSRTMAFDAAGNLIEGDDGGIYRRTNPRLNTGDWFSINGNAQI